MSGEPDVEIAGVDFEEAIRRLDEGIGKQDGQGLPQNWAFLAMAHDRLGHQSEARRWLDRFAMTGSRGALLERCRDSAASPGGRGRLILIRFPGRSVCSMNLYCDP